MEIFIVTVADLTGSCLTAHKSLLRLVCRRIEVEDQKPQIRSNMSTVENDRQTNIGRWMHANMVGITMRYV